MIELLMDASTPPSISTDSSFSSSSVVSVGFWGRAEVVRHALSLLVAIAFSHPHAHAQLLSVEDARLLPWLRRVLLEAPEPNVRKEACFGFYRLVMGTAGSPPASQQQQPSGSDIGGSPSSASLPPPPSTTGKAFLPRFLGVLLRLLPYAQTITMPSILDAPSPPLSLLLEEQQQQSQQLFQQQQQPHSSRFGSGGGNNGANNNNNNSNSNNNKDPYGPSSKDYFWLVSRLIDHLPKREEEIRFVNVDGLAHALANSIQGCRDVGLAMAQEEQPQQPQQRGGESASDGDGGGGSHHVDGKKERVDKTEDGEESMEVDNTDVDQAKTTSPSAPKLEASDVDNNGTTTTTTTTTVAVVPKLKSFSLSSPSAHDDLGLNGTISLLTSCLKHNPPFKFSPEGRAFLSFIFDSLFSAVPSYLSSSSSSTQRRRHSTLIGQSDHRFKNGSGNNNGGAGHGNNGNNFFGNVGNNGFNNGAGFQFGGRNTGGGGNSSSSASPIRSACYDVMIELVKGSFPNFVVLADKLSKQHCRESHDRSYPWDYWPDEDARSSCDFVG